MAEGVITTGTSTVGSATETTVSISTLKARVRRLLEDEPFEDTVDAVVSTSAITTLTINSYTVWADQDIVEFDDDTDEQAKVQGTPSTATVTVKRGHNDTTATTHASGCVILKNPRFGNFTVTEALTRVTLDLWPRVWKHTTQTITYDSTKVLYALNTDYAGAIALVQSGTGTPVNVSYYRVDANRDVASGVATSGMALYIPAWGNTTNTLQLTYRAKVGTSDIVEGLMADAVVFGACARLLGAKDVPKTGEDVAGGQQSRPGDTLRTGLGFFESKYRDIMRLLTLDLWERFPPKRRYIR